MGDKQAEAQQDATHSALDVQIIDIDSYMAAPIVLDCKLREPYNIFDEPLKQVPVLRIFGATKSRQRICLHVHQVWPYMYIRYDGPHDPSAMRKFGYQLGLSLNHALNIALNSSGMLFVAAVVPVKGVPFYGYHVGYRPFLKIFLSNPKVVSRAGSLLASGAVMGRKMDIFESHLPYTLQFLVDYNLYGMGWINLSKVLFRSPLPGGSSNNTDAPRLISDCTVGPEHRWVPQGMPTYLCNPHPPERICRSELEADVIGQDIINRQLIPERQVHHKLDESEFK
ncbi:DNA polymerase zeta, partial [Coemansia sp. RSA 2399]